MNARCRECRRYLDGLTDGAERHPIYEHLCVSCGASALAEDGGWSVSDQRMRESGRFPEASRY